MIDLAVNLEHWKRGNIYWPPKFIALRDNGMKSVHEARPLCPLWDRSLMAMPSFIWPKWRRRRDIRHCLREKGPGVSALIAAIFANFALFSRWVTFNLNSTFYFKIYLLKLNLKWNVWVHLSRDISSNKSAIFIVGASKSHRRDLSRQSQD